MVLKRIDDKKIGDGYPCYIIAEMSANHAGDFKRAIEIIHEAKKAGADCIKIQTYTPDTMTIDSDKEYFKVKDGTWKGELLYNLYKKAYTPWEWQEALQKEAKSIDIDFLSTPFDKTAVDFLENLNVEMYKIASFECVDIPLIKYIASKHKPIILSTGMASLGEIEDAVNAIKSENNSNFCLLKCSSAYPAIPDDMNLKTIQNLKDTFQVPAGLSDHSLGSISAITAVALGANIIEKHFCISREIKNPDSSFSMEPKEFKEMVEHIRLVEKSLGKISYERSQKEEEILKFRRSIFAVKNINKGDHFNEQNIRIIRPGYGLLPKFYLKILNRKATKNIERGTPISWDLIN